MVFSSSVSNCFGCIDIGSRRAQYWSIRGQGYQLQLVKNIDLKFYCYGCSCKMLYTVISLPHMLTRIFRQSSSPYLCSMEAGGRCAACCTVKLCRFDVFLVPLNCFARVLFGTLYFPTISYASIHSVTWSSASIKTF